MTLTRQNDTAPLARVIVKHARDALIDDRQIDAQWRELNYPARPDLSAALAEYDEFVAALNKAGAELYLLPPDENTGLDSLYPRDAAVMCEHGAILCSMGKAARRGEPAALKSMFRRLEIPVCGEISGAGLLEGGDVVWLGEQILAVGLGYRTNAEGIEQLRELLTGVIDELIVVPLPHWRGPNDVFHLMSMISPIDSDLAAVYSPLLPVPFRERLLSLGIELVEIPDTEFATQACNILALGPRNVLIPDGNPQTQSRLVDANVAVHVYRGTEISQKGGGGPTCLTRPLERYA
ncbi:MAG: arginine deiminase family protein [Gammaproteobacteria bacterium]|nr:arginine deiminase family protein [Gammaproteobacteria bacterium]